MIDAGTEGFATHVEAWWDLYEDMIPDMTETALDYEAQILPVHPDPAWRAILVVDHPASTVSRFIQDLPRPSYTFPGPRGVCQSVWWLGWPVEDTAETSKLWNTWDHVANVLAFHLQGRLAEGDGLVKMTPYEEHLGPQTTHILLDLKAHLTRTKMWTQQATAPRDLKARGGRTRSEAQTQARRMAMAKARNAHLTPRTVPLPPLAYFSAPAEQVGHGSLILTTIVAAGFRSNRLVMISTLSTEC